MPNGFVIMQIGDTELDHVYDTVIAPVITDAGLVPRRIDIDNSSGLLKSEIVEYLERSHGQGRHPSGPPADPRRPGAARGRRQDSRSGRDSRRRRPPPEIRNV
jgi:hypothetical protein